MVRIGLTGGIASGKSTVARMLQELGAPVVDADQAARAVVAPGTPTYDAVVAVFGPGILHPDGHIDRPALGRIVFADAAARQRLEAIIHPAVRAHMAAAVADLATRGAPVVVLDIPLLIEGNLQRTVDRVWLVYVDADTQLRRLMARDGLDAAAARQRMAAQMPLDQKRPFADIIIDNSGTVDQTRRQVAEHWAALMAEVESQRKGSSAE